MAGPERHLPVGLAMLGGKLLVASLCLQLTVQQMLPLPMLGKWYFQKSVGLKAMMTAAGVGPFTQNVR